MGIETCVVPTAVLSTHTGGFTGYTYRDLTSDIPDIAKHWKSIDLKFDAVCTGYLGSFEQIKIVSDFFDDFKTDNNLLIVDPVMGDKGRFYTGFTNEFATEMRNLCKKADVILPNLTEASLLLGEEYVDSGYDEEFIKNLLIKLSKLGSKIVVLTGVSFNEASQGVMSYNRETGEFSSYFSENIPGYFHSTGDVFSSTLSGALVKGFDMGKAIQIAVDFTVDCIKHTLGSEKEHWYGVKFEECIPNLIEMTK
jgi:pyridoxine kinase